MNIVFHYFKKIFMLAKYFINLGNKIIAKILLNYITRLQEIFSNYKYFINFFYSLELIKYTIYLLKLDQMN